MESLTELRADETLTSWLSLISSWLSPTSSTSKVLLPASLSSLSLLRGLDLSYRGLSEGEISIDPGSLSSLQELNLSGNKFFNLPSGIGLLPKLNYLLVKDCTNLLSVPELPSSLMELDAVNCSALERLQVQIVIKSKGWLLGLSAPSMETYLLISFEVQIHMIVKKPEVEYFDDS